MTEARRHVATNVSPLRFEPQPDPQWAEKARRYAKIEERFAKIG
jgi:hypothetical protein